MDSAWIAKVRIQATDDITLVPGILGPAWVAVAVAPNETLLKAQIADAAPPGLLFGRIEARPILDETNEIRPLRKLIADARREQAVQFGPLTMWSQPGPMPLGQLEAQLRKIREALDQLTAIRERDRDVMRALPGLVHGLDPPRLADLNLLVQAGEMYLRLQHEDPEHPEIYVIVYPGGVTIGLGDGDEDHYCCFDTQRAEGRNNATPSSARSLPVRNASKNRH